MTQVAERSSDGLWIHNRPCRPRWRAAKSYGDALIHNKLETTGLINLHALVSRMRIMSSQPVIESAIKVVKVITDTYNQPNKTPEEIEAMISNGSVDILLSFSEACREEFE